MSKIKKISNKLPNGFSPPYPLGADALNVDMLSGNNLEEEFHLGCPNDVTFDMDIITDSMKVVEKFKSQEQNNGYYILETIFNSSKHEVLQKLSFYDKDNVLTLKKTQRIIFESQKRDYADIIDIDDKNKEISLLNDVAYIESELSEKLKLNINYFRVENSFLILKEANIMNIKEVME